MLVFFSTDNFFFNVGFAVKLNEYCIRLENKRYQCTICGRTSLNMSNFRRHFSTHHSLRRFQCPECGKHFKRKDYLKLHMVAHQTSDVIGYTPKKIKWEFTAENKSIEMILIKIYHKSAWNCFDLWLNSRIYSVWKMFGIYLVCKKYLGIILF